MPSSPDSPKPRKSAPDPINPPLDAKAGCPTGCGCSGFLVALILWTPAMIVARANSGVGSAAIGITLLVSLPVVALLLAAAKFSLSGKDDRENPRRAHPHWLFAATYLLTFAICLLATFFLGRAAR